MSLRNRTVPAVQEGHPRGRPVKRPLGQVLLDGGFATPSDLDRALEERARTNDLLEEIVLRLGIIDPWELESILSIQGDLTTIEGAIQAAVGTRKLLGELLLDARRITADQLEQALREQEKTGEKLGEILVRRGLLTDAERDAVLVFQKRQGEGPASKFCLGEILVATGQITREQLDRALAKQRVNRKRIGELLVEAGHVHPHQVERTLKLQRKIVTAALVAMLAMAGSAGAQEASRPVTSANSKIDVTARVQARVMLKVVRRSRELVITDSDITQGYVDVPAASSLEVRNNDPRGYLLVFEVLNGPVPLFETILVRGLGSEVQIGLGSGWVPQPFTRGVRSFELSYRFILHKDARPGSYAWPVLLSANPI